jgi:hypothetical protein
MMAPEVLQEAAESSTIAFISEQNSDNECDVETVNEKAMTLSHRSSILAAMTSMFRPIGGIDIEVVTKLTVIGFLLVLVLQIWSMRTILMRMETRILDLETQNNLLLQELVRISGKS